jgi:adenine deaminase
MERLEGIIVDPIKNKIFEGIIWFDQIIEKVEECPVQSKKYIFPGFVDSHVHIESSMVTPFNYSKEAIRHGVIASVTDPHEIANVCGMGGVEFMVKSRNHTPMKIQVGIPSCVPATSFETSGANFGVDVIRSLFETGNFSHLSEMMNFPGIIYDDKETNEKVEIAHSFNKTVDGHAPLLSGDLLKKYVETGIYTDHECTSIAEAEEKLALGMKVLMRKSSASNDFPVLMPLLEKYSDLLMFCTDDCHPDDLSRGYINLMVKEAYQKGYDLLSIVKAASVNPVDHYKIKMGLLQVGDPADFVVVDNLDDFNVVRTVIDGKTCWDGSSVLVEAYNEEPINNFYLNPVSEKNIQVKYTSGSVNVIEVIPNSLVTGRFLWNPKPSDNLIKTSVPDDVLKIVVLNRYEKAVPSVGFIKGFGLKEGALAASIAHDSHNIICVGVDDSSIVRAITKVQQNGGGLLAVSGADEKVLPLPFGGLMSGGEVKQVAADYLTLVDQAHKMGCYLYSPFMTMAFMALLVIPDLKISDKGLFDGTAFQFINLQNS